MSDYQLTKPKFSIENIKKIIQGKDELIEYDKTTHDFKDYSERQKLENRIHLDDDGRLYQIKDGKKVYRISREQYGLMPAWCPICNSVMGRRPLDFEYWKIHKRCMNCSIELQHQMRVNGTWGQYERNVILNNIQAICKDAIVFYEELKEGVDVEFVTDPQLGTTQKHSMENKQNFLQLVNNIILGIKNYIEYIDYYKQGTMSTEQIEEKIKQDNQKIVMQFNKGGKNNE